MFKGLFCIAGRVVNLVTGQYLMRIRVKTGIYYSFMVYNYNVTDYDGLLASLVF